MRSQSNNTCVAQLGWGPDEVSHEASIEVATRLNKMCVLIQKYWLWLLQNIDIYIISAFVLSSEYRCSQAEKPTAAWDTNHM